MRKHYHITRSSGIPLIGTNNFGIIDRGTNLLQIRPVSGCVLDCIFCSVDEGKSSKKNATYSVEPDYLLDYAERIVDYKETNDIEYHIDGMGEPLIYEDIVPLIKGLRNINGVRNVSMQTHGTILTSELIKDLEKAGLSQLNLSINSMNIKLCRELSNTQSYDLEHVKRMAELVSESKINLMITPLIVPSYNAEEIPEIIMFAKKIGASLGIQKYMHEKLGRKVRVKEWSWKKFTRQMKKYEKKYGVKLLLKKKDFNIHKCKSIPIKFKKGEKIKGRIVMEGWLKNERIITCRDRCITVFNTYNKINETIHAKIVRTKHGIYLAKKI